MSDYSNTFTESTGDTIDTTDFSTEFSAIETAIATKADSASPTLTSPTLSSPTITGFAGGTLTLTSETATTSGTTVDITSIPSWVKKITVLFALVDTDGTSFPIIQLGDSGGIEATGYLGSAFTSANASTSTIGIIFSKRTVSTSPISGAVTLYLQDSANNTWVASGTTCTQGGEPCSTASLKPLSAALDRIRLTTTNGTDAFESGAVSLVYEG
jgi:hypothetical protein